MKIVEYIITAFGIPSIFTAVDSRLFTVTNIQAIRHYVLSYARVMDLSASTSYIECIWNLIRIGH